MGATIRTHDVIVAVKLASWAFGKRRSALGNGRAVSSAPYPSMYLRRHERRGWMVSRPAEAPPMCRQTVYRHVSEFSSSHSNQGLS